MNTNKIIIRYIAPLEVTGTVCWYQLWTVLAPQQRQAGSGETAACHSWHWGCCRQSGGWADAVHWCWPPPAGLQCRPPPGASCGGGRTGPCSPSALPPAGTNNLTLTIFTSWTMSPLFCNFLIHFHLQLPNWVPAPVGPRKSSISEMFVKCYFFYLHCLIQSILHPVQFVDLQLFLLLVPFVLFSFLRLRVILLKLLDLSVNILCNEW